MRGNRKFLGTLVCGLGLMAAMPASANTIQFEFDLVGSPVAVSGGFEYTYAVKLTGDSQIDSDSYVTLFDFQGWDSSMALPTFDESAALTAAGFSGSVSAQLTGTAVPGVSVTDSASLWNFTVDLDGSGLFPDPAVSVPTLLGTFKAISIYGTADDVYSTASYDIDALSGLPQGNRTDGVWGPVSGNSQAPAVVPLPSAVWGGMGLIGFVIGMRLRRTRSM